MIYNIYFYNFGSSNLKLQFTKQVFNMQAPQNKLEEDLRFTLFLTMLKRKKCLTKFDEQLYFSACLNPRGHTYRLIH
jgi:hypothetical protein